MGIRDYISSAAETISGGVARSSEIVGGAAGKARAAAPYLSGAWQNTHDLARVASESAVWTTRAVAERMPDREGWEKVGRVGWRIADHAIDHGTKLYTGGIPVYKIVKEELGNNKLQEQSGKEKKENMKVATLITRIECLEKENKALQELKLRMESLEKKLVKTKHDSVNQKTGKKPQLTEWSPLEPIDLI